jgi:hypothetical protein
MAATTPDWIIRYWPLLVTGAVGALLLILIVLVRLAYRFNTGSPPQRIPADRIPKYAGAFFSQTGQDLGALGFEVADYIHMPELLRGAEGFMSLWIHHERGTMATCTTFRNASGAAYVTQFMTCLAHEPFTVVTNNLPDAGPFKPTKYEDSLEVASVSDVHVLHRLHQYREQLLLSPGKPLFAPPAQQAMEWFTHSLRQDLRRQAETGHWVETKKDIFVPTVRGVLSMTLNRLPPIGQIRRYARRRHTAKVLAEAERTAIDPIQVTILHENDDWPPTADLVKAK